MVVEESCEMVVTHLSEDRLAFTNKVFVHSSLYDAWKSAGFNAVRIDKGCFRYSIYDLLQPEVIALSAKQREFLEVREGAQVTVCPVRVETEASAHLVVTHIYHSKHIDAQALQTAVQSGYVGQPVCDGQLLVFQVAGNIVVECRVSVNGQAPVLLGEFCLESSNDYVLSVKIYP